MIKVSVLYPNTPDGHFDLDYYLTRHIPLVQERCGDALKRGEIEQGINAGEPGTKPPFRISGHLFFESTGAMENSLFRHMPELLADIPNYTNIQPTLQISEVLL